MRILRAAAVSGVTLVAVFLLLVFIGDNSEVEPSMDLFTGILLSTVFLWCLGAGFAALLLLPLKPLADRTKPGISLALFLVCGFAVPAYFSYLMLSIGVHGDPAPIQTESWQSLAFQVVKGGGLGASCALTAWLSIRKSGCANAA